MFGYNGSEHPELVKEFFNFVTQTESLQEILDNSPAYTNIHVNDVLKNMDTNRAEAAKTVGDTNWK